MTPWGIPGGRLLPRKEVKSMSYTASGLVDYVKKALKMNTVYMWGGIMRLVTESYISGRANQYPSWYTPARVAKFRALIGKDYYGVDCVGLIKSYYWGGVGSKNYKAETDKSANGMFQAATEKGPINTLPEIPGVCVWLDGHIGVYIGNGLVIESTNNTRFGDGVCQTKLSDRNWTHWLKCPYIEYEDQSPSDGPKATVGTEEQKAFINKIGPMAMADMKATGILASLTIAQAILESGWGKSKLATEANNLFGIKGTYNGQGYTCKTQEWDGSKFITVEATFRKYPSWAESLADHSDLFNRLDRYKKLRGLTDYKLACKYVYEAGYATDPGYTDKLISLIEKYNLTAWDIKHENSSGTGPSEQKPSETVYIVKKGDTLSKIAAAYGTTYQVLAEYNGIANPNIIHVGQKIKIPSGNTGGPPAKTYKPYTVKKGDSLWAIAQKELGNGSRWPEIQKLNGLSGTTIYAGQVLKIPV